MATDTVTRLSLTVLPQRDTPHRPSPRPSSIVDTLLAAQADLIAVDRFSRHHNDTTGTDPAPAQAKYYRDLIPLTAPGPGQQYAFEVDLDACSGCKACVAACHTLNGLDEDETWRSVGLLVGGASDRPLVQHVTTACHHCVEPACLDGCPVLAYEKDPATGIVRHLDDQCIGCQYCILKCPYDVPKYNKAKGIVRKCDMCAGRLAAGEAPACVQGCPTRAIRIRVVDQQHIVRESESHQFIPGAADPDYTLPTTSYKKTASLPRDTLPADYYRVSPEHAHVSLMVMLVLTQLSVGAFLAAQVAGWVLDPAVLATLAPFHATTALFVGLLAIGASTLHLGRPLLAFRAVLGLRTSWLSREIVAFGAFAALATAYAAGCWIVPDPQAWRPLVLLGYGVAATGLLGVACSVMIYHDTRRPFWHARNTGTKFLLSTLLLGCTAGCLTLAVAVPRPNVFGLKAAFLCIAILSVFKMAFESLALRHVRTKVHTPMKRSAILLLGPLLRAMSARLILGTVGGVLLPLLAIASLGADGARAAAPSDVLVLSAATFAATIAAELLERYLFFTAVVAPRMPGSVHHHA